MSQLLQKVCVKNTPNTTNKNRQINLRHKLGVQRSLPQGEVHRKENQAVNKKSGGNSAHIAASASCGCKATHVRKVRNSDIVQVPVEATAAGRAPQNTGNRAAIVL